MTVPPHSSRVIWGVEGVFKKCVFGSRMEGEIHPKALTFPVDNLHLEIGLVAVK